MRQRKRLLRNEILKKLADIPPRVKSEKSRDITERVRALPDWDRAAVVLAFISMPEEVDTSLLIDAAFRAEKKVGIPRMGSNGTMEFHLISSPRETLEEHPYGVKEPPGSLPVIDPAGFPDLPVFMLTPGLAFDRNCGRLGRGKGYYDSYLSRGYINLTAAGVCFSEQIVNTVPAGPLDVPLHIVVTENETIRR